MLETERLLLRRMTAADVDGLIALNADPEVRRFISNAGDWDRDYALERLAGDEHSWSVLGRRVLIVRARGSDRFLGRVGIFDWEQFGETEVGWAFLGAARGHGYATEAARACQAWGFDQLGVPYVTALIRPDNAASIAVAERLGMEPLRLDQLFGVDVTVYAIDRASWAARVAVDR